MNSILLARHKSWNRSRRAYGFTLIELMVVVAVVAILAAIAIPSYSEAVRKGRRGQAKADLVEAAQVVERYRTVNNTYVGAVAAPAVSPKTGTAYYNIAISNTTASTFRLRATPIAGTDQANDRCGILTVNQAGTKWHSAGGNDECGFGVVGP